MKSEFSPSILFKIIIIIIIMKFGRGYQKELVYIEEGASSRYFCLGDAKWSMILEYKVFALINAILAWQSRN